MRNRPDLFTRFVQYSGRIYLTAINAGELIAWAVISKQHQLPIKINELIDQFEILDFDLEAARIFGQLRGDSILHGRPVIAQDLMIAAIALQHNFTLVTHNTKDFKNILGLRLEDWLS